VSPRINYEFPTKNVESNDPTKPKRFISQQHYSKDALSVEKGRLESRILLLEDRDMSFAKSEEHLEKFSNIKGD